MVELGDQYLGSRVDFASQTLDRKKFEFLGDDHEQFWVTSKKEAHLEVG